MLTFNTVQKIGYLLGMEYTKFNDRCDIPDDASDGRTLCSGIAKIYEGNINKPPLIIFTGMVSGHHYNIGDTQKNLTSSVYVLNLKTLKPTKNSFRQILLPSKLRYLVSKELQSKNKIDQDNTTIKNICSNSDNSTDTNTTNKLSNKTKQILNVLGLEDAPDIKQLLSDTNAELESGYELLDRLNKSDFANIETETNFETEFEPKPEPEQDILAKVSKAKTSNKKSKQMYTNSN